MYGASLLNRAILVQFAHSFNRYVVQRLADKTSEAKIHIQETATLLEVACYTFDTEWKLSICTQVS